MTLFEAARETIEGRSLAQRMVDIPTECTNRRASKTVEIDMERRILHTFENYNYILKFTGNFY